MGCPLPKFVFSSISVDIPSEVSSFKTCLIPVTLTGPVISWDLLRIIYA